MVSASTGAGLGPGLGLALGTRWVPKVMAIGVGAVCPVSDLALALGMVTV